MAGAPSPKAPERISAHGGKPRLGVLGMMVGAFMALAVGLVILIFPLQAYAIFPVLAPVAIEDTEDEPVNAAIPTPTDAPMPTATATASATAAPTATPSPTATVTATATPSPVPAFRQAVASARVKVPILMYHYIRVNPNPADRLGFNLSVTPDNFAGQVEYLTRNGYRTISFEQLAAYFEGKQPLPPKPIILNFDDGYHDFYTSAYPVLKKYGQTGTVFVPTTFIGRNGYLTSNEIAEMAADGIEFGGHTARHVDLRRISSAQAKAEIVDSKQSLERLLGRETVAFAYPAGSYNEAAIAQVKAAGYRVAVTTQYGIWHRGSGLLALPRVRMSGSTTITELARQIEGP